MSECVSIPPLLLAVWAAGHRWPDTVAVESWLGAVGRGICSVACSDATMAQASRLRLVIPACMSKVLM